MECGCEVRKGVRADSGCISGADVSDTEKLRRCLHGGCRHDKRQVIIEQRCTSKCVMLWGQHRKPAAKTE